MRQSRIAILFALALLVSISIGAGVPVVHAFPPPPDSSATVDGPVVVRFYFRDRDHLDAVAGELDIWETHPDAQYVVAAVTPAQYRWLESLGYRLEIDAEKTALLTPTASLDHRFYFFDNYYTNTDGRYVVDFLQETNADYPDLTELVDIGDAWMAGQPDEHDRDIWVLRITNEDPAYGDVADKPAFFLFATIHAREVTVPELAIRYIKYLTEGYGGEGGYDQDADVTWLVNHNVAYVLVMQNPDGHWKNEQDTSSGSGWGWRKNTDDDDGCTGSYDGVDLNRNHSFLWGCCGGSSGDPCSETYRGPGRRSEPETEYFENYFGMVMRDQNGPNGDDEIPPAAPITTTGIFISLHSYGDLVLWPWAFDDFGDPPNYAQLRTIGRKFAYYNGYDPSATIWYDVDGATDDWTYGKFGIPSYTFEVGSGSPCGGFFPPYGCIDGIDGMPRNFWAENKPAFLYAHKIARTPYATAYGPDAHNLSAVPNGVFQGAPVQLTATIADHRYTGDTLQPVAAAEYYIDVPPWVTTTEPISYTMTAADGAFDDTIEDVEATLDTIGLSLGRHIIFVRGQDANRNWGPFTAVFLNVTDGAVAGVVRDDATGAPIDQAEVGLFGGFFDQSTITGPDGAFHFDAYSGTYTLTATAYSYHPVTVTNVVAATGVTTTWTISLTAFSVGTLTGQVTQANTGLPLAATISATSGYTVLETASDPATGLYSLVAFSDTYTLTARSSGHVSVTVPGVIVIQGQTTTQDLVLQPHVQLQLDKTAAPAWVFPGDLLTYTLTLTNSGAVSATYVVVTDALPARTTFAWASGGGVLTDSVVAWNAPTVFPQETFSRTLVVTVTGAPTGTPLVNATYGVRSDQSLSPVWGQPVTVTALCNASLTGVDFAWMPDTLYPGALVTFTAVVTGGVLVLPDDTLVLPVTYAWDLGDESLPVTGNPITHAYSMAGDYTATLSVTNVCHVAPLVARHSIVVDTFFFPHHFYLPLVLRGVGG